MIPLTLTMRFRSWLAGTLFVLAGKLDRAYDVWLDDAPRRDSADPPADCTCGPDEYCSSDNCKGSTIDSEVEFVREASKIAPGDETMRLRSADPPEEGT